MEPIPVKPEEKNLCPCCNGYGYVRIVPEQGYSIPKKKTKILMIKKKEDEDDDAS